MKILHQLSQRPDSTGSGAYVQAMIREATACGYDNYLVAGVCPDYCDDTDCIEPEKSMVVKFPNADVSYPIHGMSDVMPYLLSEGHVVDAGTCFGNSLGKAV